ncbi:hypothetical protein [Streptomyces sp. Ac-502]|uniref:hypothetical protein n=1 Tax=Streptomyces sp. Ac-502 TaxID=3342801 RepID=UPI0038623D6C
MTDDSPTKPFVLRKRSIPDRLRHASQTLVKVVDQIASGTPGDHRGTLIGTSFTLDQTADEIEQQQADTASEYLALAQHTDTTCEAAVALDRVRALHTRNEDADYCNLCADHGDIGWPCATIAALDTPTDRCAACGHPADQHTEADEPVSVGQCRTCVAQGDEDDAGHDYDPPKEAS